MATTTGSPAGAPPAGGDVFVAPPAAARWRWLPDRWLARLAVSPTMLLLLGLFIFPLLYAVVLSFTDYSATSRKPINFIGFENYGRLLTSGGVRQKALTTLIFVI